jgi:hypothetical protein
MNDITADELNQAQWHQQMDYDERRQQVMDSWQRIKAELEHSPYADRRTGEDIEILEAELRQLL